MQIFAFRDDEDFNIVKDTFMNIHVDWAVLQHGRDKYPGYPAVAITSYNHQSKILNFTFLSPGEVSRVAAVLDGRLT